MRVPHKNIKKRKVILRLFWVNFVLVKICLRSENIMPSRDHNSMITASIVWRLRPCETLHFLGPTTPVCNREAPEARKPYKNEGGGTMP